MTTTEILKQFKTIAVYGMSKNKLKPACYVPLFMEQFGYKIIPINPSTDEIEGKICYRQLIDVPEEIDILNVFRPASDAVEIVKQAIERKKVKGDIKVIWLQLDIENDEAKELAESNGFIFIQNKCIKIEFGSL